MPKTKLCKVNKSNRNANFAYPLPSSLLPSEWSESFDLGFGDIICERPQELDYFSESELQKFLTRLKNGLKLADLNWCITSHWIYKLKWNRKYVVPGHTEFNNLFEAEGQFFASLLNLCAETSLLDKSIPNPRTLFGLIIQEFRIAQLNRISESALENIWTKRKLVDIDRQNIQSLNDGINPYDSKILPHLSLLINSCLNIVASDRFPVFNEDFWLGKYRKKSPSEPEKIKGFLEAYADKIANDLREECQMGKFSDTNELQYLTGRGKHMMPASKIQKSFLEIL